MIKNLEVVSDLLYTLAFLTIIPITFLSKNLKKSFYHLLALACPIPIIFAFQFAAIMTLEIILPQYKGVTFTKLNTSFLVVITAYLGVLLLAVPIWASGVAAKVTYVRIRRKDNN